MGCCLLFLPGCILPTGCPARKPTHHEMHHLGVCTALLLPTPLCTHHAPPDYTTTDAKDRSSLLLLSLSPLSTFHYGWGCGLFSRRLLNLRGSHRTEECAIAFGTCKFENWKLNNFMLYKIADFVFYFPNFRIEPQRYGFKQDLSRAAPDSS